jgi:hypothetical protein
MTNLFFVVSIIIALVISLVGIQSANAQVTTITPAQHKCISDVITTASIVQGVAGFLQSPSEHGKAVSDSVNKEINNVEDCITNPNSSGNNETTNNVLH